EGRCHIARCHQAGDALEIEVSRRDGRRADECKTQRWRVEPRLLDAGNALDDSELGRKLIVRCLATAEIAASRKRTALEPLEQLLETEACDYSFLARKARGAIEALGQLVDAVAGAVEVDGERAFPFELAQTHELTETLLQVDIAELDLRLDRRAGVRLGETEGAIGFATKRLGLADRHGQAAAPQIGRPRRASKLHVAERDAARRQPQIEVDAGEAAKRHRLLVPLIVGERTKRRYVGREIERIGRERSLQQLATFAAKRQH